MRVARFHDVAASGVSDEVLDRIVIQPGDGHVVRVFRLQKLTDGVDVVGRYVAVVRGPFQPVQFVSVLISRVV